MKDWGLILCLLDTGFALPYYEYALPMHPPPPLSQQTALQPQQPRLQAQNTFLQPTQMPARE
ncbi:ameloblastin [Macrochelys suwanniensis]